MLEESEERFDRGQPYIACPDCVSPVPFQMLQEVQDEFGRQLLDRERATPNAKPFFGKVNELQEAAGVAIDSMLARAAIARQVLVQELAHMGGKRGHREILPRCVFSAARAISRSRTGVASRYQ